VNAAAAASDIPASARARETPLCGLKVSGQAAQGYLSCFA
jgi:hypothetical protein